jgi:hypothetical protein
LTWRSLAVGSVLAFAACGSDEPKWTAPPPPVITDESVIPVSIGAGPQYVPGAREPQTPCTPGPVFGRYRAHIELFANRRAIVIPEAIGLRSPRRNELDRITNAACRAQIRTLEPTGVVEFDDPGLTLEDLFETWGVPYDKDRMLTFSGPIEVFVAGEQAGSNPPLTDRAQIVVEIGGYVPPHRSFTFPPRG